MGSNRLPITIVPVTPEDASKDGGHKLAQAIKNRHFESAVDPSKTPDLHGWHDKQSSGGLATALRNLTDGGRWVGWPGLVRDDSRISEADYLRMENHLRSQGLSPLPLSRIDKKGFYDDTSNGWFWLGMHSLTPLMSMAADWPKYVEVNKRYADAIVREYKPGQVIWIHDYQLTLVPQMVREALPQAAIGFFLHIPFPPKTTFFNIPHSREMLEGLLGADYVSFQTTDYLDNFLDAARDSKLRPLKVRANDGTIVWRGRVLAAGHNPISVSREEFESLAKNPNVQAKARALRQEWTRHRHTADGGVKDTDVFVAVDRLDPTKGLPHKLTAFQELLREYKALGKDPQSLKLVHVTPSTREDLQVYRELKEKVDGLVAEIHAEFGEGVLVFHYNAIEIPDVAAHYLAAEVLLCTPLADGMNLTPKEAIVTWATADKLPKHLKLRRKPGVVVLSEQAGAARELVEAVLVNAYHPIGATFTENPRASAEGIDIDGLAQPVGDILEGMRRALHMPVADQRRTLENLSSRVRDVTAWRDDVIGATVKRAELARQEHKISPDAEVALAAERIKTWPGKRVFLLAFDALQEFAESPRQLVRDPLVHALMKNLASLENTEVHVVSGGSREQLLRSGLGDLNIGLHAEHGLWSRPAGENYWIQRDSNTDWMPQVREVFDRYAADITGSFVEGREADKHATLAFHWGQHPDRGYAERRVAQLKAELESFLDLQVADILEGDAVIEVRPAIVTEGLVLKAVMQKKSPDETLLVVYLNPASDDDLGADLPKNIVVVGIGTQNRRADVRLADVGEARDLLRDVLTPDGPPVFPLEAP